jgi:molecular chaperone HtpG
MYVSPVTIYREYIQNAADAIDAARTHGLIGPRSRGEVSISFDHAARSVVIRDNGIGLGKRASIGTLLAIGASSKRGTTARGFRGVGRLSGLAYCRELEFRTKAAGEDEVSVVRWSSRAIRDHLRDTVLHGNLEQVLADTVTVRHEKASKTSEHFFEVRLNEISRLRNDILLNERMVGHYLSEVAPLPFSPDFSFGAEIEKTLSLHRTNIPLNLTVADETIVRPHHDEIIFPNTSQTLHMNGIQFVEFPDVDGKTGAIAWIADHEYIRSIPPSLGVSGIRARNGDLQVGEANIFEDVFKERRFNGWSIGELHVLDQRIIPNARRDNFEINHHYYNLLVQLGPQTAKIAQRCRSSSIARNNGVSAEKMLQAIEDRLKQRQSFDRAELSRLKSALLRAEARIKRIDNQAQATFLLKKIDRLKRRVTSVTPKRGAPAVALDEATALITKIVTNREQGKKLLTALQRLCQ